MKHIRLICLLMVLLMLFCACNGEGKSNADTTSPETTPTTPPPVENPAFSAFQIVRPDDASQALIAGMQTVNDAVRKKTGKGLSLKTDYRAADESSYEILIGNTKRDATKTVEALLKPGDYVIQTVITDSAVKVVVLGETEALTVLAAELLAEMLTNGEVIDEKGNIKTISLSKNLLSEYENFRLDISEPIVVYQAEEEDHHWGHYQFPSIYYTSTGALRVTWAYGSDSIYDSTARSDWSYSEDGGSTWIKATKENQGAAGSHIYDPKTLMPNGKYFAGFVAGQGYQDVDYLSEYEDKKIIDAANTANLFTGGVDIYYADDIEEYQLNLRGSEYDPVTKQTTLFPITFNWPYMPLVVNRSPNTGLMTYITPPEAMITINNTIGMIATENGLYYCLYSRGFDGKTGKATPGTYYSIYVFHSADNGRSWNYVSQVDMSAKVRREISAVADWKTCGGFCEPTITMTSDGTFIMLLRTGNDHPSYIVRSTDGCKTWSEPEIFDECGVLPQLLAMDCGVTLASYGRPTFYLRATSDASGKTWQDHIEIPINDEGISDTNSKSCYYTRLIATGSDSAIMVYVDFNYPNAANQPRKTILIRKIQIVPTA